MNTERFIELVRSNQEPLRRFLITLCCGNREEAEDIAQDTFVKAYLSSPTFEERYKFSTWLFKIAYNTYLDRGKRAGSNVHFTVIGEDGWIPEASVEDDNFKYQGLYQALNKISERERTAILLHYIGGYSVKESANIMGCSPGALKLLLMRGRNKLKELLDLE
ncbi:MAG: RNA polymerase sigma factor [Bacteroidales bacterium]|nr:RNA polymerase sigma factor [Bacteroidales bacterium]